MNSKLHDLTGQDRTFEKFAAASDPALKSGGGGGTFGGMEARINQLEQSFVSMQATLSRMDGKLDQLSSTITDVKVSQAHIEERMERVMDRAREMPTTERVDGMIKSKMGMAALLMTGLAVLIAAITYAAA